MSLISYISAAEAVKNIPNLKEFWCNKIFKTIDIVNELPKVKVFE